jgi:hypothetical protein
MTIRIEAHSGGETIEVMRSLPGEEATFLELSTKDMGRAQMIIAYLIRREVRRARKGSISPTGNGGNRCMER